MTLHAGDVLLYESGGFYGWLIKTKTWHHVTHVEIALSPVTSTASRNGIGVGIYPTRTEGLKYVLRPSTFNVASALAYVDVMKGTPYGWLDLLNFMGWHVDRGGIVCSPYATEVLRAGGVPVFGHEPALSIAPFQFLTSELLVDVTQAAAV